MPRWMKWVICCIRCSFRRLDRARDAPNSVMPYITVLKLMASAAVMLSTAAFRNHGLAIANALEAKTKANDLASRIFASVSSMRMNKCLVISFLETVFLIGGYG